MLVVKVRLSDSGILTKEAKIVSANESIPLTEEEQAYFRNTTFFFDGEEITNVDKASGELVWRVKVTPGNWNLGHRYPHREVLFSDMDLRGKVINITKGKVMQNRITFEGPEISTSPQKEGRKPYQWFVWKTKGAALKKVETSSQDDYIFAMRKQDEEILNLVVNASADEEKVVTSLRKVF